MNASLPNITKDNLTVRFVKDLYDANNESANNNFRRLVTEFFGNNNSSTVITICLNSIGDNTYSEF